MSIPSFGKRVGGALPLDFINTVRGRVANPGSRGAKDYADRIVGERVESYEAFLDWAVFADVLTRQEAHLLAREALVRPAAAARVLGRSLALREALYRIFKAAVEGWSPRADDVATVNQELRIARAHETLIASPRFEWVWGETNRALDRPLWAVVRSAAELLTSSDVERVGQCPGDECGWLFLDTSRSHRRQWCDMAECGNVAKVRRFRQNRRGAVSSRQPAR